MSMSLLERWPRRLAAADDDEQVGIGRLEGADAEVGEHVADRLRERPAAGVAVQGEAKPWPSDVQGVSVDHGAADEQRPQDVFSVDIELGDIGAGEPAQSLDVAHSVQEQQERAEPWPVVDDDAGGGAHLQVCRVSAQQWRSGSDDWPQGHQLMVTFGPARDDPVVHIETVGDWSGRLELNQRLRPGRSLF